MSKTKIFVIYHKPEEVIKDDVFTPICVGPNKDSFSEEFLRDDVGDNIADKNDKYNELTAIYWVYKHLDEFKDVEYIGFEHYRRLFAFSKLERSAYVKKNIDKSYIATDDRMMDLFFRDYDMLVPSPTMNKTVRKHYEKSHDAEDLKILQNIIDEKYPEYSKVSRDYIEGHKEYLYNMFVFKRQDFIQYSEFIFGVVDEFIKRKEVDRLYISERVTGIFIQYLISQDKSPLNTPVYHVRKKNHKAARMQAKENKKKGYKFFMRNKPLLLYYLPRWLEQYYRRRITR